MTSLRVAALFAIAILGCRDATGKQEPPPAPAAADAGSGSGSGSAKKLNSDYVPAEHKSGMARWKDTVVYVDGQPIGYLTFGELPIALKPVWVKVKMSQNKPAGCPTCLAWKWGEQRFYRFNDYFKAMHVDIAKIKQIHVQGPKVTDTIVATAKDMLSPAGADFMFRFGIDVGGKAIPKVPFHFGNGFGPDKITSVMVYITKKPPTFDDVGYLVDGIPIEGVPYYGEPMRGGVRVYLDDKLAAVIKRQELDIKKSKTAPDNEPEWNLYEFLKTKGVDTSKVVEGWVIRDEQRTDRLPAAELATIWFEASSQASGGVTLGDKKLRANVLALHTRAIKPEELPVIRPEER